MYYSSGNYEAFARPRKPEGVERKSAWLVGSGLASLAAACFLYPNRRGGGTPFYRNSEPRFFRYIPAAIRAAVFPAPTSWAASPVPV